VCRPERWFKDNLLRVKGNAKVFRLDRGQIEVVDDAMADILRQKTPGERIRIGFKLWTSARNMLRVHLRRSHPEWSAEVIEKEVVRRLSGGIV